MVQLRPAGVPNAGLVESGPPKAGNPVAVVHGAENLSAEQMQNFANWTNLSETTFRLEPAEQVLELQPDFAVMDQLRVGVIGSYAEGGPADFEVRVTLVQPAVPRARATWA